MTLPIEQSLLTRRALALRACLPQRLPTGEPLQWATPISTFIGGVAVGAVLMLSLAPRPQGESSAATLGGTLSATRVSNPVGATPVPAGPEVVETARSTSRAPLATPRPATPRAARFQGSLTVTSHPAGAEVRVNGRLLGTTPLTLRNIPVGSRALQVKLGDHEVWSRAVQVVADRHTRVTATLTPASLDGSALR